MDFLNNIYNEDCINAMKRLPDKSVDLILCDLPYGTTSCSWDAVIPFADLWNEYKRIIKPSCPILLFAIQPFATDLINSNREWFKYEWIWNKGFPGNVQNAKHRPLAYHELILVFGNGKIKYNPQLEKRKTEKDYSGCSDIYNGNNVTNSKRGKYPPMIRTHYFPKTILEYSSQAGECNNVNRKHPTQKPLEILQYLIQTYSDDGDIVLDNTMGVGSTCVAAKNTGRKYIGIEKEEKYFKIAKQRLNETLL